MGQRRFGVSNRHGGSGAAMRPLRRSDRFLKMPDSRFDVRICFCPLSGLGMIERIRGVLHEGCGISASALVDRFRRFPNRLREMFRRQ